MVLSDEELTMGVTRVPHGVQVWQGWKAGQMQARQELSARMRKVCCSQWTKGESPFAKIHPFCQNRAKCWWALAYNYTYEVFLSYELYL